MSALLRGPRDAHPGRRRPPRGHRSIRDCRRPTGVRVDEAGPLASGRPCPVPAARRTCRPDGDAPSSRCRDESRNERASSSRGVDAGRPDRPQARRTPPGHPDDRDPCGLADVVRNGRLPQAPVVRPNRRAADTRPDGERRRTPTRHARRSRPARTDPMAGRSSDWVCLKYRRGCEPARPAGATWPPARRHRSSGAARPASAPLRATRGGGLRTRRWRRPRSSVPVSRETRPRAGRRVPDGPLPEPAALLPRGTASARPPHHRPGRSGTSQPELASRPSGEPLELLRFRAATRESHSRSIRIAAARRPGIRARDRRWRSRVGRNEARIASPSSRISGTAPPFPPTAPRRRSGTRGVRHRRLPPSPETDASGNPKRQRRPKAPLSQ